MDDVKTTGHRLARDAILLTASNVVAKSSVLLLFVLLSYLLTTEEYGNFRQVWMINKSLMEIFAFGIPLSIYYFLPRMLSGQKSRFIIQSLLLLQAFAVLFALSVFVFSGQIAAFFNNPGLAPLLQIFCLYPLFALPALAMEGIMITLGRATRFAIFTLIDRFLLLALTALVVTTTDSLETLLIAIVAYSVVELAASLVIIRACIDEKPDRSAAFSFGRQLRFAFPGGLSKVVGILNQEIDKLMIASFYSVSRFAVYANGAFEVPFVGTIASSVTSVMMPEYSRRHKAGDSAAIIRLWHGAVCKVAVFLLPLAVFLFVFAEDVITLLFSSKYAESTLIFQIYLIALLPKVTWYGPILVSMGYNRVPLYGSIVALVSNVILNYWFIMLLGFPGPALATVLTTYILTSYYLHRIMHATGIGLTRVFPWRQLVKMFLSALAMGVLVAPLAQLQELPAAARLAAGLAGYALGIFVVYRSLQLITREDMDFIFNRLPKTGK